MVDIALIGAEGEISEAILEALSDSEVRFGQLHVVESGADGQDTVLFRNRPLVVEDSDDFDFRKVAVAIFASGDAEVVERASEEGSFVLIAGRVPEGIAAPVVLPGKVPAGVSVARLAEPQVFQMVAALDALTPLGLVRMSVTSMEPASGVGREGVKALAREIGELLNGRSADASVFPAQLAFNLIPAQVSENRQTLADIEQLACSSVAVDVLRLRVPVFYGLTQTVRVEFDRDVAVADAESALSQAGFGIRSYGDTETGPLAVVGNEGNMVAAVEAPVSGGVSGLNLWTVSDNIKVGMARNVIQLVQNWLKGL